MDKNKELYEEKKTSYNTEDITKAMTEALLKEDEKSTAEAWASHFLNSPEIKKLLEEDFLRYMLTGETRVYNKEVLDEMTAFVKTTRTL